MAICAGVQNVSRPIERCQEISHCPPTMADVTARTEHHTYQGTLVERIGADIVAMLSNKNYSPR
jgi:hypothetical protein